LLQEPKNQVTTQAERKKIKINYGHGMAWRHEKEKEKAIDTKETRPAQIFISSLS
jgi:hypothetical protein